ncbi:hypothetical protein MHBO_003773 [Bonamia ostreae]|uniref:DNA sliding clamp PCNA n=1 Tax=Bonamia ostreae TaxID=126728 RepID=A0ABV2ARG8_9EUKA
MDSSHVAVVSFSIKAENFEHYRVDRNFSLGVDTRMISKILRRLDNNNILTLRADESADTVNFCIQSTENDKEQYSFDIKKLNIDSERLNIPEKDYDCNININSSDFARVCQDLSNLDETVTLSADGKGVVFEVSGEAGSGKIEMRQSGDEGTTKRMKIVMNEDTKTLSQKYALSYLLSFVKASSLANDVTLCISENTPLLVEYEIDDFGFLRFYLAPKVFEEDDDGEEETPNE